MSAKQVVIAYRQPWVYIRHIHSPDSSWLWPAGEPSAVAIRGIDVLRPDLRESTSVRDQFKLGLPRAVRQLFSKVYIGLGSMHDYASGGFMKEHLDSKRPDESGLPHIMTLVVSRGPDNLLVCGKVPVFNESEADAEFHIVMFTLNCPHEVTPVNWSRRSFAFPVYGEFTGLRVNCEMATNLFDAVIDRVRETDPRSENLSELQGWVKALRDEIANALMFKIRIANGDWISDDNPRAEELPEHSVKVEYEVNDEKFVVFADHFKVPEGATQVFISLSAGQEHLKEELLDRIVTLRNEAMAVEISECTADPIPEGTEVPSNPFVVRLCGRYFGTDGPYGQDLRVQEFLISKGLDVAFVRAALPPECCVSYEFRDGRFEAAPTQGPGDMTRTYNPRVEFNDSGAYDPQFTSLCALLVVN